MRWAGGGIRKVTAKFLPRATRDVVFSPAVGEAWAGGGKFWEFLDVFLQGGRGFRQRWQLLGAGFSLGSLCLCWVCVFFFSPCFPCFHFWDAFFLRGLVFKGLLSTSFFHFAERSVPKHWAANSILWSLLFLPDLEFDNKHFSQAWAT